MPVVGCPKCKQKFQLPAELVGKTIKCTHCQTAFKTAAVKTAGQGQKAAGQAKPAAKSGKSAKSAKSGKPPSKPAAKHPGKSSGKPNRKPAAGTAKRPGNSKPARAKDDLFGQPIPSGRGPDPLGNFSLEDPGFADSEDGAEEEEVFDTTPADKKHLLANPAFQAAKSAKKTKRKEKKSKKEKPKGFIGTKIFGNLVVLITGAAFLSSCLMIFVIVRIMSGVNIEPEVPGMALLVGWICTAITAVASLVYWPLVLSNQKALGSRRKAAIINWEIPVWAIALVLFVVLFFVSKSYKKDAFGGGQTTESFQFWIASLVAGSLACLSYMALILRVIKDQYKNIG